jgi:RHS repeat-associated protein
MTVSICPLSDHLGSIRAITDNTGAVIDQLTYTAFGVVSSESNVANGDRCYKYAGYQYNSEQGDYYDNAREYRPDIGKFGSEDPSGLGPDVNPNRYVFNGPTDATDPTGLAADQPTSKDLYEKYQTQAFKAVGWSLGEAKDQGERIKIRHGAAINRSIRAAQGFSAVGVMRRMAPF